MASRMFAIGDLVYCCAGKGRARLVCPASKASKTGCRGRQVSCIKTHEHLQCSPQKAAIQHPCADSTCSCLQLIKLTRERLPRQTSSKFKCFVKQSCTDMVVLRVRQLCSTGPVPNPSVAMASCTRCTFRTSNFKTFLFYVLLIK